MSNTSTVTPYESETESNTTTATSKVDLFSWLADTDEDRAVDQRAREDRNRQLSKDLTRKHAVPAPPVMSIELHMKTTETLLKSGNNAGYKVVREVPSRNTDLLVLQGLRGDRVIVEQTRGGGVRMHAAHSRFGIDSIMRRHTLDRAVEHLAKAGLQVTRKELSNGEIQLLARGTAPGNKEELHAQIRKDGSSIIDVVDGRGPGCEDIVRGYAEATNGQVTATHRKDDYYLLPERKRPKETRAK